jgi:toluene monooxygenase system protein A
MGQNVRDGNPELTLPETFPVVCNSCQLPVCTPAGYAAGYLDSPLPYIVEFEGRKYTFCSEPCKWVFEMQPETFAGHLSIIDRLLAGWIQPPDIPGALAYMGLTPEECGVDGTDYDWAGPVPPATKSA